jgi:ribosomal protein S18 acetylase RimI-like enzyme
MDSRIRIATPAELLTAAKLLHRFNREFDEPAPTPEQLAKRLQEITVTGETLVLLAEDPATGIAVVRFRLALWSSGLESYLAELYVTPERRRFGLGRALLVAGMEQAQAKGADSMDLGSDEGDVAAHSLYESLGFTRHGGSHGELSYFYEREL